MRFKKDPQSPWQPAVVKALHRTLRSCIIKTSNGQQIRKNRIHLQKTQERPEDNSNLDRDYINPGKPNLSVHENNCRMQPAPAVDRPAPQLKTSRYGRL